MTTTANIQSLNKEELKKQLQLIEREKNSFLQEVCFKIKQYLLISMDLKHNIRLTVEGNSLQIDVLDSEDKKCFGSGISIRFTESNYSSTDNSHNVAEFKINYGSFAFEPNKSEDSYMIAQFDLLSYLAKNIYSGSFIANLLNSIVDKYNATWELLKPIYVAIGKIESQEKEDAKNNIERIFRELTQTEGKTYSYETMHYKTGVVTLHIGKVVKITPKFITIEENICGEMKFKIENFKSHLSNQNFKIN